MNDPTGIKRRYRQFADMECKGYSDVYYGLALAVSEDDEVVGFIAEMPVVQPNLFLASVQLLTGPDGMPRTGSELRAFLKRRGGEVGDVMRSGGCSRAFGRIIVSVGDDSKVRSTWPEPSLPQSVLATWLKIFPPCWPRYRTTPSSSYSTPRC